MATLLLWNRLDELPHLIIQRILMSSRRVLIDAIKPSLSAWGMVLGDLQEQVVMDWHGLA